MSENKTKGITPADAASSYEGWQSYLDVVCNDLSESSKEEEQQLVEATLLLKNNPETGEPFNSLGVGKFFTVFHGKTEEEYEGAKEHFSFVLKTAAVAGGAVASTFCTEAWLSKTSTPNPRVPPSEDPERLEALIVMADHKDFDPEMRVCFIDTVDGKRALGEWQKQTGVVGGRFSSFVPPERIRENKEIIELSRIYYRKLNAQGNIEPIEKVIERLEKEEAEKEGTP